MANFDEVQSLMSSSLGTSNSLGSNTRRDPFAIDDAAAKNGFHKALEEATVSFGDVQKGAQAAIQHVANGSDGEVHDSMMAIEKANTTFKFGFTCLKKAIECYKEITQRMG